MTHNSEPDETPDPPMYEGRRLARDHDEIVDQGASFDIATVLNRRNLLGLIGLGIGAATLAACAPLESLRPTGSPAPSGSAGGGVAIPPGEIPEEMAGPFPGDGSNGPDVLKRAGIVRSDIRSSIGGGQTADGVPLTVTLTILDAASGNAAVAGVAVYVWQCDAQGDYSMYSDGLREETYLRGVQVADADGRVTFTSIVPGCYTGRWPHIHLEVYPNLESVTEPSTLMTTSQLAFPETMFAGVYALDSYAGSARRLADITLATDMVFREDNAELQMASITGDATRGFSAALTARIDTRTS